jgi:sugar lactone lactonase YvrE
LGAGRLALLGVAVVLVAGCGGGGYDEGVQTDARPQAAAAPGSTPVDVELLYVFENERTALYYPFEGLAGIEYADDGTLIVCDEKRGFVFGLDPRTQQWFEFSTPRGGNYRPVDVRVDGFQVLVLDIGGRAIDRYDLGGPYRDRLVNFPALDPGYDTTPAAFDVDIDGRVAVADGGEDQILLLDSFLSVQMRVGTPGPHRDQFSEPSGVGFLPDGGFMVSDRDNRRLQRYNRLGYFEAVYGGGYEVDNPFITPQGLDVDRWGNVFVADPAAALIHVLGPRGQMLFAVGPGLGLLATPEMPMDVALGPGDLLAVSDRSRGVILVFRVLYE